MSLRPAAFAIPGDITQPTGGYYYERRLLEGLRERGRDVQHLQIGSSFPDPTPTDMADLIAQLCALEPDRAVILDGFLSATIDSDALYRLHVPTVAMVHHPLALESGLDAGRRDFLFQIERANLALISHVLVPSPHTAEILTNRYDVAPDRITIARPGTDRPVLPPAPADPPLILSVGIQHPRKGHDIVLKSLAELRGLEWSAVIVGAPYDTQHAAELAQLVHDLDLTPRVQIAGRVSDDTLAQLYSQASVFALATRYEGYGLVFDEALAAGLPIVSCATGAVPDTVPKAASHLVPSDDPQAFAKALEALLSDPAHRAQLATASQDAGRNLPTWLETAKIAGSVLDDLPL
ncbi:glycosyltransferase family 4 protein [Cognatishimia sp. MH4019]|uniref:glycosyltransferase family 4 protein n=1 Tax=Cognatishimia sp. MH4019 TaxID=2854030 RepID=UPI001CD1C551|nr:glycosyltransferase family 4 protein [Cognatishimia sp. MH4019]